MTMALQASAAVPPSPLPSPRGGGETLRSPPSRGTGEVEGGLLTAALALTLAAAPALAQDLDALLAGALASQRVALTCSALDPEAHPAALDMWNQTALRVIGALVGAGRPMAEIQAFTAAARPEALILPDATPFAEVRAFCAAHPDWAKDIYTFRIFGLGGEVERMLAP